MDCPSLLLSAKVLASRAWVRARPPTHARSPERSLVSLVAARLALSTTPECRGRPATTSSRQGSEGSTGGALARLQYAIAAKLTNKPNKVKRITYGRGYGGFNDGNRCGITDGKS